MTVFMIKKYYECSFEGFFGKEIKPGKSVTKEDKTCN